jgi:hypothetical protein
MYLITTVDTTRFTINGIQYFKNYISAVHGQRVEIFNCYERADVLLQLTHFSQVKVNGVAYTSAAALQSAMLPVIYTRDTLGTVGVQSQNNIDITKTVTIDAADTVTSIVAKINQLAAFSISVTQSVWFVARSRRATIAEFFDPTSFDTVSTPIVQPAGVVLTQRILKYKMLNKGVGTYGAGGTPLTVSDLELVYSNENAAADADADPETDVVTFVLAQGQSITQWLNARTPAMAIQPQDDGYTIFRGQDAAGTALSYLWVGSPGTYGQGALQSAAADFQVLQESASETSVPTFQQTLQQNPVSLLPAVFQDDQTQTLLAVGGGVIKIKYPNNKTIYITGTPPDDDYEVNIPRLTQNDHFLLRSEVSSRWVAVTVTQDVSNLIVPQLIGAQQVLQIGGQNMLYNDFSGFTEFAFSSTTGKISGFDFYAGFTYHINFLI